MEIVDGFNNRQYAYCASQHSTSQQYFHSNPAYRSSSWVVASAKVVHPNYFAGNILMHPAYRHIEPASNYPRASKVLDNVFFLGCSPVITMPMLDYIYDIMEDYQPQ